MEQTAQETLQQASSMGSWTWLQAVAAFGTVISVFTLGITIWNNLTRLRITVRLNDPSAQSRVLVARVVNKSKIPVFVDGVYLESGDGQQLATLDKWGDYHLEDAEIDRDLRSVQTTTSKMKSAGVLVEPGERVDREAVLNAGGDA